MTTPGPTIRIARPTNNLATIKDFYTRTLGLRVIGSFEDHSGFDGVMLGHPEYSWHLEFTYQRGITVKCGPPTKDNLLVFYEPDKEKWEGMIGRIEEAGAARVKSENPYWDVNGVTFEDPDGWRIVLQNAGWP